MTAPRSRAVVGAPSGGSAGAPAIRPRGPTAITRPTPTPIVKTEPAKDKTPAKSSGSDYDDDFDEGG